MARLLRSRQTKRGSNRHAQPKATATHFPTLAATFRLRPKTASSRLTFVHRADLEEQLRVDMTQFGKPSTNDRYFCAQRGDWNRDLIVFPNTAAKPRI